MKADLFFGATITLMVFALLAAVIVRPTVEQRRAERAEQDMESFKEDVRLLMNEIDNAGDLPKYTNDKRFLHIYYFTHNLEGDYYEEK